MHTIKDDSVLVKLKFVSKYEDNQVYGQTITNVMISREIIETTTYKTYLAFSTGKASPKKSRKRTKAATTPKKESSLTADDNIISEDPDAAFELAKSINRTKAEEQEAAKLVHEIHKLLVTKKSTGVQVMSFEERLAADTKKAIKASKLVTGPQQTAGSSEGAGLILEVPDEPKVDFVATDVSKESWGNESDTEKSNKEEVPWIYSDDDEEDYNVDDQSTNIEEMDDDELSHPNYITNFRQRFDESFSEAWDRFKDLLCACRHHGFSELHQLDTFYNALNSNDQDSLNSVPGGNFMDKMPRDCLAIIESKSKVRYSRSKEIVSKVSMSSSTLGVSPDVAELKEMVKALRFLVFVNAYFIALREDTTIP
ncbi:hypothetical protein Tco_1198710 [Tanacetum coccineum]